MSTESLERAIASTRAVLANVQKDTLQQPTPCADWNVGALINHIVGGQFFFAAAVHGQTPESDGPDFSAGEYLELFDTGSELCVEAFRGDGVMEKIFELPFGTLPGAAFVEVATSDTFTHGWDLARATGQDTNLSPDLARQLLEHMRQNLPDGVRNEQGNPFGLKMTAPAGSYPADELAAFLGRTV